MEPAWTQFESTYKKKINLVMINTDETTTPEFKKYGKIQEKYDGIPLTLWIDAKGKVLKSNLGGMDAKQLSSETDNPNRPFSVKPK